MTEDLEAAAKATTKPEGHFTVTILGAGSATPMLGRHPTAQVVTYDHEHFLIDCGEGTQFRLIERRIKPGRLQHIFISHLHGDHYFGLAPLLSSLNLSGRTEPLYLYGPRGLDEILTTMFRVSDTRLGYPLYFTVVDPATPTILVDRPHLTIENIPLEHRITCSGYLFREKSGKRKLLREKLPDDVLVAHMKQLKEGKDVLREDGSVLYDVATYTAPGPKPGSYAFCSDTRFSEPLIGWVKGVDILYHEATFLDVHAGRADEVFHSTARQAASIARQAGVGQLIIGHFSSRYKEFGAFLEEAQSVFTPTLLAEEGKTYIVG
ncbi:ribonuclease Z [Arsenicibacter rosenii]|uniref:Ribonuclease Z n=1 Tax=Arsenicibacter rosenii TaxID=1750698 RepID=A0A1S2VQC7_9BACT|nr:ribonuclease Z [Arsenicibacter rosenii]OIN60987.1 ribonuclease Z [Arsenicibacter rosenii]